MAHNQLQRAIDKINARYATDPSMSRSQLVNTEKMRRHEMQQLCAKAGQRWMGGFVE